MGFRTAAPLEPSADGEIGRDLASLDAVARRLDAAGSAAEAIPLALEAIRVAFGFDYGAGWAVDARSGALHCTGESGSLGGEIAAMAPSYTMNEGQGLCGRAWRTRDVVHVCDLAAVEPECERSRAALRAGARRALSIPVVAGDAVVACLDFFGRDTWPDAAERRQVLRTLAGMVSSTVRRLRDADRLAAIARDQGAVTAIVSEVGRCDDEQAAIKVALDTVRADFDWVYGSYWAVDESGEALRFVLESGSAGEEFRAVTLSASFRIGVGLSGRAWRSRDLVFVPDLGDLADCVRAPVAQRAGVRSGVCFPIIVGGAVTGTMDFFTTESIELSDSRREALRNVSTLVSQRLEALRRTREDAQAAAALLESVGHLSVASEQAVRVAEEAVGRASAMAGQVQALRESSTAVEDVIGIISKIADQTNLLALNATIEAARAGEVGRGFAVVAGEVKELAKETARATGRVGEQVAAIQENTDAVAAGIEAVNETIGRIDAVQGRIGEVLDEQRRMAGAFVRS